MSANGHSNHLVTSLDELKRIYGEPGGGSIAKETDRITAHYRALIESAPFFALASAGDGGLDCSPRGDAPGFVRVHDEKTLLIPDRRGNNRIDTLRNIVRDPRVSLCVMSDTFFGPWVQIEGTATLTSLPEAMEGLVDYYRRVAGEHPNWDEYRQAMEKEQRVLVRVTIERAGPNRSG